MLTAAALALIAAATLEVSAGALSVMRPIPFTRVQLEDSFWRPRIEVNHKRTIPHNLQMCTETGRIANFAKAAGKQQGPFEGIFFNDSDVYKVLEGVAHSLALFPDETLHKHLEEIIDLVAAAQQPDGYLNTYFTLVEPGKRWTDLPVKHEMYCAGHLIEAAVAHYQATGSRMFLEVAIRLADCIDGTFGPGKRNGFCGHEEIELALLKLWQATGETRYRDLAAYFLHARGQERNPKEDYCQAHCPLEEHTDIVGHAVRAMYLYSAAADLEALSGHRDYIPPMERVWKSVAERRMYLTGGIGSKRENEGFSADYDLPNDTAYCETCASIGMVFWNHRMLLLQGDGKYGDVLERVLYNGFLSGVSLDGTRFFYENPLASRGHHHRKPWFECACCPPNVVRLMPTIGGYLYGESGDAVWLNLYATSSTTARISTGEVEVSEETGYPWMGEVKVTLGGVPQDPFSLCVRIPSWCDSPRIRINGKSEPSVGEKGYFRLTRRWKKGDVIRLSFPMEIRRMVSHPAVRENQGKVAIQRGPLVYCLEEADHPGGVRTVRLPDNTILQTRFDPNLLGGVQVIEGQAQRVLSPDADEPLYREAPPSKRPFEPVKLKAIPYYAWDNRGPGEMVVWIPGSP